MTNLFWKNQLGSVQVLCGDSLRLMTERLAPKSVDVVVTSPPYNAGMNYSKYRDNRPDDEYLGWLYRVFAAIKIVLKDNGSFFLNVGSKPTAPKRARLISDIAERHFEAQNQIIWVKSLSIGNETTGHCTPLNSERFLNHNWEYVLHLTKNGDVPLDQLAIGVPYKDRNNVRRSKSKRNLRCRGDVWHVPHETTQGRLGKWNHPCPFPSTLAEWCIRLHGVHDEMLALDPFNGVGSSTVAMTGLGVRGVGIDIDPAYCEAAVSRIEVALANELIICIEDCFSMRERPIPPTDILAWAARKNVCDETVVRLLRRLSAAHRRLIDNGDALAA